MINDATISSLRWEITRMNRWIETYDNKTTRGTAERGIPRAAEDLAKSINELLKAEE